MERNVVGSTSSQCSKMISSRCGKGGSRGARGGGWGALMPGLELSRPPSVPRPSAMSTRGEAKARRTRAVNPASMRGSRRLRENLREGEEGCAWIRVGWGGQNGIGKQSTGVCFAFSWPSNLNLSFSVFLARNPNTPSA